MAPVSRPPAWSFRIGFGILWILDGVLQIQSAMPLGMPGGVLQPAGGGRGQLLTMVGEMAGTS